MKAKNDCTLFEELLISRIVLNDISKTNDKKLTSHLKKCDACSQREKDLLLLNRASKNIPELKPSRKFEKNLYKILEIPPLEKERKASRLSSLFRFERGMSFLKPAAAFLSIIFVQAVLLRVYFLPPAGRSETKVAPSAVSARTGYLNDGRIRSTGGLKSFLGGHRIDAQISTKVETKSYYKKIKPEKKTVIRYRNFVGANNTTVFAKKKPTRQARRAPMKSKGILKNLDNLNIENRMRKTDKTPGKTMHQDDTGLKRKSDTAQNRGQAAGNKAPNSMADRNAATQKGDRTTGKSTMKRVLEKKAQARTLPNPQSINKEREKPKSPRLVRATRKVVTVTLLTSQQNRTKLRKLSPVIRKRIRNTYGKDARIRLRYAYNIPNNNLKQRDADAPRSRRHGNGMGYLIILIIMALEGTVRILLIVDLKRSGRINVQRVLAAAFFGTLYLPVYLMQKQR